MGYIGKRFSLLQTQMEEGSVHTHTQRESGTKTTIKIYLYCLTWVISNLKIGGLGEEGEDTGSQVTWTALRLSSRGWL